MACNEFSYSTFGRQGIGVNQPQSGVHYPFVLPSSDVRYLIADFYLAYESAAEYRPPLQISWIYGLGCEPATRPSWAPAETHAVDIVVTDASGAVVFDSTTATAFDSWDWGARHPNAANDVIYDYKIYQWVTAEHVCRLVAYSTWVAPEDVGADEDIAKNYPIHITPENAVLDARCVYKMPKRTNSIRVKNGSAVSAQMSGLLSFEYGYNTDFAVTPRTNRGLRAANEITLNVAAGSGRGRYFNCPETPDEILYSINGLTGPNILISALDCLWTTTPTTLTAGPDGTTLTPTKIPGEENAINLLLASNCPACCGCNDYVLVGNYMNRTADRYRPIGGSVSTIVAQHTDNIDRWSKQIACRLQRPLRIDVTRQRCPLLDVVAQYCNQCDECVTNVKLKVAVRTTKFDSGGGSSYFNNTASLECGYTNVTTPAGGTQMVPEKVSKAPDEGEYQIFICELGKVDIGNSAKVDFRLRFANPEPTGVQLILTATADSPDGAEADQPIKANCGTSSEALTAVLNTNLLCTEQGDTNLTC